MHAADDSGRVARAQIGVEDLDGDVAFHGPVARRIGVAQTFVERCLGDGRYLAGHTTDGETVGAVGGDLHLQHPVGEGEVRGERGSSLPVAGQLHGALALGRQPQLGLRHDHARRLDTAQLGIPDLHAVGHGAARKHDAHSLAGRDVGSSAHDGARLRLAYVDDAHRQLVGVGMALTIENLADHEATEVVALGRHTHQRDPLDLGPGEGQT